MSALQQSRLHQIPLVACIALLAAGCARLPSWQSIFTTPSPTPSNSTSAPVSTANPIPPPLPNTPATFTPEEPETTPSTTPSASPPTRTPFSAVSPGPTRANLPAVPSPTPMPPSNDLLFLKDKRLTAWSPAARKVTYLANQVDTYVASGDGAWVALLQSKGDAPGGVVEIFDLLLLDLVTHQTATLLEDTPRLYSLSISQFGEWVSFVAQPNGGNVVALNTNNPEQRVELGVCVPETNGDRPEGCDRLAWSPDSNTLLWADSRGLWRSDANNPAPTQAAPGTFEIQDPRGNTIQVPVIYQEPVWSPLGRYALAWVHPQNSEVRWQAIVDTTQGRAAEIFGTYTQGRLAASLVWLPDGRLLVARNGGPATGLPPAVEIWSVIPTTQGMLGALWSYPLETTGFPGPPKNETQPGEYILAWPGGVSNRYITLAALVPEVSYPPALFSLDLRFGTLQKLIDLPSDTESVLWAPDGSGALVFRLSREPGYLPADGSAIYDLQLFIGEETCCFTWLPGSNNLSP